MGIQGLLPTLKSIITPVHVRQYAGKKAAIDTYSWLHKAAYTCSKDICEGRPTKKYIDYCMHRVNLLRHFGVHPVLVFDGGVLPMKAEQEAKRARSRKEHLERAQEHERAGNYSAANDCYQRAVDITPAVAFGLIKVLQQEGVEYVVAPYEADAQMAYLALNNLVDLIITEDSDLIAYGCSRILFKMNRSGEGDEFQYCDLVRSKDLNFVNFTKQMVLEMCVMTGCDYLPSLPGMGVKKAHGLIRRFKSYQKVIRHLRFSGVTISAQYEELFERAILTFRHQRVYDPVHQEMVHLTEVPIDLPFELEFVGPELPQKLVKAIAEGEVDPSTNLPFQGSITKVEPALPKFGYKRLTHHDGTKKSQELLAQKNVLTNYFISASQEANQQFKAPRSAPCAEPETKNLPANDASDTLVPETENFLNLFEEYPKATDFSKVFGSPLCDDDDENTAPVATQEVHENIPGFEPQQRGDRDLLDDPSNTMIAVIDTYEPVGLNEEDALESSAFERVSSASTAVTGRFSVKEIKKKHVNVSQVKLSGYFLQPQFDNSKSVMPETAKVMHRESEADCKDVDSCFRKVKKSRINLHEGILEKVKEGPSHLESLPGELSGGRCDVRKSTEFNGLDKRNRLSTLSKFYGSSDVGKFSSNVCHVDQFAHVAQKSMDRFVEAIAPFRCSSKGTRASGLRAPMNGISMKTSRTASKGQLTLEATLRQFSYESSTFKTPRLDSNHHSCPRLVTTGAVRCQDTISVNWL